MEEEISKGDWRGDVIRSPNGMDTKQMPSNAKQCQAGETMRSKAKRCKATQGSGEQFTAKHPNGHQYDSNQCNAMHGNTK